MLSPQTQRILDELHALMQEREAIDQKIEALFGGTATLVLQSISSPAQLVPKRKGYTPKGKGRGATIIPKFTDDQLEQMYQESEEGKTARDIVQEYGLKSTSDWYQLKAVYKKKRQKQSASDDLPAYDASDDEEAPDDAPAEPLHIPDNLPTPPKRYHYECTCGYGFKSGMPPQLVKCPDCRGKPKLLEELVASEAVASELTR
jgi:hypothetical protein